MKIAMLPRDIAPVPNWIVPALSLASIWSILRGLRLNRRCHDGRGGCRRHSLLIILNRRQ
jgi:hypothetical protein